MREPGSVSLRQGARGGCQPAVGALPTKVVELDHVHAVGRGVGIHD